MLRRLLSTLAVIIFACSWSGADAAEQGAASAAVAPIVARVEADRGLQRFYRMCPADVAGKLSTRFASLAPSPKDCSANPEACYQACSQSDSKACFDLAQALEDAKPAIDYRVIKPLFAVACALGDAGACTNRASSLRNVEGDDPLDHAAESAEVCEFRSFNYACAHNDAWGCAMLGQAALNGEGIGRSLAMAQRSFAASCRIEPDSDACAFARKLAPKAR